MTYDEIKDSVKQMEDKLKPNIQNIEDKLKKNIPEFLEECLLSGISEECIVRLMRIGDTRIVNNIIQIHLGAYDSAWMSYAMRLAEKYDLHKHRVYVTDLISVLKSIAVDCKHESEDYGVFLTELLESEECKVIELSRLLKIRNSLERNKIAAEDLERIHSQMVESYNAIIEKVGKMEELQQQVRRLEDENKKLKASLDCSVKTAEFFKVNKNVTEFDIVTKMTALSWGVEKINVIKNAIYEGIELKRLMDIILRDPNVEYLEALIDVIIAGKRKRGEINE